MNKPLLVLHAATDRIVGVENARRIFEAALHPKSFVSLDDADHLMNNEADARYAADVLSAWAARYIDEPAQPGVQSAPDGFVRVSERGTGMFANTVSAGRHTIIADEPVSVGGTNLGLTPYQLLQAAVGTCTAMTIRMVANRKKWPLERVTVDLDHDKIHATDCEQCETETGKIDHIDRFITLEGPLDDAQRAELTRIADRCPVHRTLHGEVVVRTTLNPPVL